MFNPVRFIKAQGIHDNSKAQEILATAIRSVRKITGERDEDTIINDHEDFLKDTIMDVINNKMHESAEDEFMSNKSRERKLLEDYVNGELTLDELIEKIDSEESEEKVEEYEDSTDITSKTDKASQPKKKKRKENFSYYMSELSNLEPVDEYGVSVKLSSSSGSTKFITLSPEFFMTLSEWMDQNNLK